MSLSSPGEPRRVSPLACFGCGSRTGRLLEERVDRELNARRKRDRWRTDVHRRRHTDERAWLEVFSGSEVQTCMQPRLAVRGLSSLASSMCWPGRLRCEVAITEPARVRDLV